MIFFICPIENLVLELQGIAGHTLKKGSLELKMIRPEIHLNMKISEIILKHPKTAGVFISCGMGALVSEEGLRVLAPFLTLGTALRSRFLNADQFIGMLQDAAAEELPLDAPGLCSMAGQRDLTLLGLMPCGLKMPFSRAFTRFISDFTAHHNISIKYAVEGNVNQELSYYPYVDTIEHEDELPDIIVSADFNAFFGHRFYNRFVASKQFAGYGRFEPGKNFKAAGIVDPKGEYDILCVNPLVLVANLDQTKGRPLPQTWADVLDPVWKKSLTIRGGDGFFCHAVLLPIFQEYGESGLVRLAANLAGGLHPSQMINQIDKNTAGALYVMPEFFAQRIRHKERIKIIWPEDGALASPVSLQVKPSRKKELQPILDYLTGHELATILANARFPVPHADVQAEVQTRPLRWLGWEYLRRNDLITLNRQIDETFLPLAP
jgi:ABC-type Fe3+ transport system substrate-binding protein